MLEHKDVAHYLLRQGLITPMAITLGDLAVYDIMRRNNNFKVISERGPSYLLKQGVGRDRVATVAHEAEVYRLLHSEAGTWKSVHYVPRVCFYDPNECILVLELLPGANNLHDYHLRLGRFPMAIGSLLGEALAALHRAFLSATADTKGAATEDNAAVGAGATCARQGEWAAHFKRSPAWVLSLHQPDVAAYSRSSNCNIRMVKIMQQFPELCASLDRLREGWRAETLIHGDLKWGNCVVHTGGKNPSVSSAQNGGQKNLKLVDWELATVGDPCWDIGSVFSDYLGFWLQSTPITGEEPPEQFLELARYPLGKMQPAMSQFWLSYVWHMGLDVATAYRWLVRSVQYAAARLIQATFEEGQALAQLTSNAIYSLQLSLNMLQRPLEGAIHLLGISPLAESPV